MTILKEGAPKTWFNGEPVCKIKRTDFGFEWPLKEEEK